MKKLLYLILILSGFTLTNTYGQAQLAVGIKGGLNFATLKGANSLGSAYDNRTGYHFGGYLMIKFTMIAIQPEILFSQQGSSLSFNAGNLSSNYSYLSIPVIVKFYLLLGLNLQTGIQLSKLTSSSGSLYNTSTGQIMQDQNLSGVVHDYDFAIPVGIGWDLPFGLNLAFRYNIGISDVNKQSGSTTTPPTVSAMGTNEATNQVFQISAGMRLFKIGN